MQRHVTKVFLTVLSLRKFSAMCICLINLILDPSILISDDHTAISKPTSWLPDIQNLSFLEVYTMCWGQMCWSSSLQTHRATFLIPNDATKLDYQGTTQDTQLSLYNCQDQKGQEVKMPGLSQWEKLPFQVTAAVQEHLVRRQHSGSIALTDNPEKSGGKQIRKVESMGSVILQWQKEKNPGERF